MSLTATIIGANKKEEEEEEIDFQPTIPYDLDASPKKPVGGASKLTKHNLSTSFTIDATE